MRSTRTCRRGSERWRATASISAARCRTCASRSRAAARFSGAHPASVRDRPASDRLLSPLPPIRRHRSTAAGAALPQRRLRRPHTRPALANASDPRRPLSPPPPLVLQLLRLHRPRKTNCRLCAPCAPRTRRCRRRCSSSRSTRRSSTNWNDSPCLSAACHRRPVHQRAPQLLLTDH